MEKLFSEELGCQPPPFTDDLSQMCNQKFNITDTKDKSLLVTFSQVLHQNRKAECKKPCIMDTYKTRYFASIPNKRTEIIIQFEKTIYITKSKLSIDELTLLTRTGGIIGFGRTLLWILLSLLGAAQVIQDISNNAQKFPTSKVEYQSKVC